MIFTSYEFILGFLPIVYVGFLLARRYGGWRWAVNFLALASVAILRHVGPRALLGAGCFDRLQLSHGPKDRRCWHRKAEAGEGSCCFSACLANLFALGYLKYLNFFIDIANQVSGSSFQYSTQIMLIGMSFFTFIQIGYLIDAYNGRLIKHDFPRYVVFAAFFPCVTAGPLVMQREMMEQMENQKLGLFNLGQLRRRHHDVRHWSCQEGGAGGCHSTHGKHRF